MSVLQAIEDDYSHSEGELQDAEEKPDPDIQLGSELICSCHCPVSAQSALQAVCLHACLNRWQLLHIALRAVSDA